MKCIMCEKKAEYVCLCKYQLLCPEHVSFHKGQSGFHPCEELNATLSDSESEILKEELMNRIGKIKQSKKQILNMTKIMIKKLENYCKSAFRELDTLSSYYFTLMCFNRFSDSIKIEAQRVTATSINIKKVYAKLDTNIKDSFTQDLVTFIKKSPDSKVSDFEVLKSIKNMNKGEIEENIKYGQTLRKQKEEEDQIRTEIINKSITCKKQEQEVKESKLGSEDIEVSITWMLEEKQQFMESLKICGYNENFARVGRYKNQVDEIKFSDDKNYSFICKKYAGKRY